MAGEAAPTKWEGKCAVEAIRVTPDQVWLVLADFCNGHKWFPAMHTCSKIEGNDGQPGLIRYCTGLRKSAMKPADGHGEITFMQTVKWAYERLKVVDPYERQVSYEMLENNMGFSSYVATMRALPIMGKGGKGCRIEWSFVCDPIVEGWKTPKAFESFLSFNLRAMARKLESRSQVLSRI